MQFRNFDNYWFNRKLYLRPHVVLLPVLNCLATELRRSTACIQTNYTRVPCSVRSYSLKTRCVDSQSVTRRARARPLSPQSVEERPRTSRMSECSCTLLDNYVNLWTDLQPCYGFNRRLLFTDYEYTVWRRTASILDAILARYCLYYYIKWDIW